EAALEAHEPHGPGHVYVDESQGARGNLHRPEPCALGDDFQGLLCEVRPKGHRAAENRLPESPQDPVRVRDRRLRAATAVAGGAWVCARADRADPKRADVVGPEDRPSPRAHLREVDGRIPNRISTTLHRTPR